MALAVLLLAPSAQAQTYDDFLNICVSGNADRQAVAAAAKSAGWHQLPSDILGDEPEFQDGEIYLSDDPAQFSDKGPPADMRMLMTGWGDGEQVFGISRVRLDVCAVGKIQGDAGGLRDQIETLLGPASTDYEGQPMWVVSRRGRGFQSEEALLDMDEEALPEVARQKKLYIAGIIEQDGFAGIIFAAVRPSE